MKKILWILGILSILILNACIIQKDIVEPIKEIPIDTPIQLSEKEQCEQQGKLWFQDLQGFECIEKTSEIIQCEQGGGHWNMFNNGCVDSCGQKPRLCTEAFQAGCDCGATQCYRQVICVKAPCPNQCIDDIYEPYATPQEACEKTGGKWGAFGKRCPTIFDVEIVNGIKIMKCPIDEIDEFSCTCPSNEIGEPESAFVPILGCVTQQQIQKGGLLSIIAYR